MKKYVFLLFLLFNFSLLPAQTPVNFGVKMGLGISSFDKEITESESILNLPYKEKRLGPFLGIFINFNLLRHLDFEFELNYLQKGAHDEFKVTTIEQPEGTGEIIIFDYQLDFVQFLPSFNPKVSFSDLDFYLKFGPSLNYLLQSSGSYQRDDVKELVFGYNVGIGLKANNIFDRSFLFEICRDMDIQYLFENSYYKYKNEIWVFKIGFVI